MEIDIKDAIDEAVFVISRYDDELNRVFSSYKIIHDSKSLFLTCICQNNGTLELRIIHDHERDHVILPRNSKEYQEQGGHKALIRKFELENPNAWKIEVTRKSPNSNYEIGFGGSDRNWNKDEFERNFKHTFISSTNCM